MLRQLFGSIDPQTLAQTIRDVVADPASNLVLAVLLLSLVSLVLLIIVVVILMLVTGVDDDEDEEADELAEYALPEDPEEVRQRAEQAAAEPTKPARKRRDPRVQRALTVAGAVFVPLLLVAAFASSYVITAQDDYCVRCHPEQQKSRLVRPSKDAPDTLAEIHPKTRCVACHEGPQASAFIANSADRVRHVAAYVRGARGGTFAVVPSSRCRSCHERAVTTLVRDSNRGLVVSHAEPIAAGVQCRECHANAGHLPDARTGGMSVCVRCHDGKNAPAKCETCHTKDTAYAGDQDRTFTAQLIVNKGDCGGCHAQKICDACHGIRMPHDIAFLAGGHARSAGFEKKRLCWRCHVVQDCGKCHGSISATGVWGHPSNWRSIHMKVTPGLVAGCGCHGRSPYVRAGQDYCLACHSPGIR